MKELNLEWSKTKIDAMERARGPARGFVAVLVSTELGEEFATVTSGRTIAAIVDTLPPSIGIYAAMQSCDPERIVSRMLSLWDDKSLKVEPYTVTDGGMEFHKVTPDNLLCDMRTSAWELFAEQNPVQIVESWNAATTA